MGLGHNIAACEDGLIVTAPAGVAELFSFSVQFGSDLPIPLVAQSLSGQQVPNHGLFLSTAKQPNGDHWALVECDDWFGDAEPAKRVRAALLVKRRTQAVIQLPLAFGLDGCIVTRTGYLCWVDAGGKTWTRIDPDGTNHTFEVPLAVRDYDPASGLVMGFAWVEDNGTAHFTDVHPQSAAHPDGYPMIHGLPAQRLRRSGDWACFLSGDFEGVYAYHYPTDAVFIAIRGRSQVVPNICQQTDGSAIVCRPLSTPDMLMAHSSTFEVVPWTPPVEPPVEPPVVVVPSAGRIDCYRRPLMMTPWFTHSVQYGVTKEFVGTVAMPDKSMVDKAPTGIALIQFLNGTNSGFDGTPAIIDRTLAYLLHGGGDVESVRGLYEQALGHPEKPIILYLDTRVWPTARPSWVKQERTYLAVQTYRDRGESVAAFGATMNELYRTLAQYWKCPLVEVPAFYDRGWGQVGVDLCVGSLPVYEQLIRDHYVMGVLPFSDLRQGGMSTYPVLKAAWRDFVQATPGRPNRFDGWLPTDWKKKSLSILDYELLNARPEMRAYWKSLVAKDQGVVVEVVDDELRLLEEPPAGESYPEEG